VELAFTEKARSRGVVSGRDLLLGDVEGRVAVVIDDLICSGTTMHRVAEQLTARGAAAVHLAATHGTFNEAAEVLFSNPAISSVVVTDSVQPDRLPDAVVGDKLTVLGIGPLLADAVSCIQGGGSLADLLHLED
jgi:ribose-phosphate pyrophosphokinase